MSRLKAMSELAQREKLTIRQLYERYAGSRGSYPLVGTPSQIADEMEEWVRTEAADGFIIQASYLPGGFDDFVSMVIPELQRRGRSRTGCEGRTLRAAIETVMPRDTYQIEILSGGTGRQTVNAYVQDDGHAAIDRVREQVMSAVELRLDSVEFCTAPQMQTRLYGGGGWKPRWLVRA